MENVQIIILAGGRGTRMQSELPKVLAQLRGKPMIRHLLESVERSGVCEKPCIVVGYGKEKVMAELGGKYSYAIQDEQLGTGHAVLSAQKHIEDDTEHVLVLYGDNPYMSAETIKKLVAKHLESKNKLTMATVKLPDFEGWRVFFYTNFSRIVRDAKGKIIKSVEFKDATDEEKKITEVNPCYFCFDSKWLIKKLKNLENNNAQKEYYLTDLVHMAIQDGEKVESINIDAKEALAANSKEELELLERFEV